MTPKQTAMDSGTVTVRLAAALVLFLLLTVGCGSDDDSAATTIPAGPTTASDDVASTTTSTEPPTSTTKPAGSTTSSTAVSTTVMPSSTLPGEPTIPFAREGDLLAVMGIDHDDVLNVRATPGIDGEIVAELEPTAANLVSTGRARKLSRSFWNEVTIGGVTGWANSSYLGFMGSTDDATAEFLDGAIPPETDSIEAMGELVAEGFAPDDPEPGLRIVQTVAASQGDLAEVTYDVIGVADDSVAGFRLHVFATPTSGGGFVLRSIERTVFCWRGVSDGICV